MLLPPTYPYTNLTLPKLQVIAIFASISNTGRNRSVGRIQLQGTKGYEVQIPRVQIPRVQITNTQGTNTQVTNTYSWYKYPGYKYPGYKYPGYKYSGYKYPGYKYTGYKYLRRYVVMTLTAVPVL